MPAWSICPRCSALAVDAAAHEVWHVELAASTEPEETPDAD
ncbi:hypothetical protein [Cellulomonas sp. APG4]|nr:hypothetical protein [Cellulomonas sp. APG4]